MSDRERLAGYVEIWWQAIDDFTALLEELSEDEWSTPTDLPGWDVRAVAAHIAHLEGVLAGHPEETVDVGEPDHVTGLMGLYTEQGVMSRRDRSPDDLINEIRESATTRKTALLTDPPSDATARPPQIFGGIGWDWQTLLRNRPLDVWMHEQDVRRAVGRPGGLDSPAAEHTSVYLAESMGYVLAKRAGAPVGTTLVIDVTGQPTTAFGVDERGRGERLAEPPTAPTVTLSMDREAFILLAGGRTSPAPGSVRVEGDPELGQQLVDLIAVTP